MLILVEQPLESLFVPVLEISYKFIIIHTYSS